jgi:tRNA (cytidine/uridine-2'-O-)-methyltransferase
MFDVVFYQPEIPPNTGNAIRMCANTGCRLHLVAPLGFSVEDARLRRAGLDYRERMALSVHADWEACLAALRGRRPAGSELRFHAFTTRARSLLGDAQFRADDILLFGTESCGLPDSLLAALGAECWLRIPMMPGCRSLNLSNAAAVAVYEAWRQQGYAGLAADPNC